MTIALTSEGFYFGCTYVACDGRCRKAWGIQCRPRVQLSDDPDDYAYLADHELGAAPEDPGTYEGPDGKPECLPDRHNKWCVRQCERSVLTSSIPSDGDLPDLSSRRRNIEPSAQEVGTGK